MASWMIHLRIAEELCRRLSIRCREEFILGNIAPDSGVPAADGTGYAPVKAVSHFYEFDSDGKGRISDALFARRHFTPELRVGYTDEEEAFYFGYLFHLITDKIWVRDIVLPVKEKYSDMLRDTPDAFWQMVKGDWYDLDFLYLRSHPEFAAYRIYRDMENVKNTYLDIFSESAFAQRRVDIVNFYKNGVANVCERETYLSPAELDVFVTSAAAEIASYCNAVKG